MVQDEERNNLLYVNVLRGAGGGISDHPLVIEKIRSLWRCARRVVKMMEMYEIKVSELRKVTYKTGYEDKLNQRWERVRGR